MTISWSCALLHIFGGALCLVGLPSHLLHLRMTLLSGCWKTFLDRGSLAVFVILIPGDWGLLGLTLLLRNIITDLTLTLNVTTNLERIEAFNIGNWMTVDVRNINAVRLADWTAYPGVFVLAVSCRNINALLLLNSLTNLLRNLMAVFLRNLATLLLGDIATFLTWNFMAFGLIPNLLTDLLVGGVTLLSIGGVALLLVSCITFTIVLGLK